MAQRDEFAGDGSAPGDAILDGIVGDDIAVLDAVDLPIILISRDCRIAHVNRAATTVLGLNAADVGRTLSDSLPGVKDINRLCARVMADGAPHRIETRLGDKSFLLRIAPYAGKDRQVAGSVLAFTNVSAFRASIDQAIYEREYTKAILNAVVDPLVVLDGRLQVKTANRAFYALFGLSRDETQGVSIRKLGNDEWATSEAWASVEASLSSYTQVKAIEIEGELPAIGRRTFVIDAHQLARDRNPLILLTFHDVTEQKQAERTTSLLAAIVGSSDDAILSKKLDGTITSWNKSAERLFGYTPEEAIGKHITLIVPWERRSEEESILRRLAEGERVDHFETVRRRKDGTTVDVSLTISPIRDALGKVVGASNVARDITERKRIEQALQESEKKYRDLAETASIALHWVAPDGTIVWANRAELELLGYSKDEYIGHNISEFHVDAPVLQDILERLSTGERIKEYEARLRAKDGSVRHVIIDSSALFEDGKFIHTRCFTRDVTERKRAEQALRRSQSRLAVEVEALAKLNQWSGRLWRSRTLKQGLDEMLEAVIELLGADKGNIQLLDRAGSKLSIAVQRGFEKEFLDFFREVTTEDDSACGRALRAAERIVIEDIETDEPYAPLRPIAQRAGYRAVVSAPLVGLSGMPLGMVSVHFGAAHQPSEQDLQRLDLYVRQAADFIERCRSEEALQQSEERLRLATEAAKIGAFNWNIQTGVNSWTPELEAMYGLAPGEFARTKSAWEQLVHSQDRAAAIAAAEESIASGEPVEQEWRVIWPDGSLHWILGRFQCAKDGTGKPLRLTGVNIDITARRQAEENYRQLAERLDAEVRARTRELEERNTEVLRQSEQVRELSWRLLRAQDEERRHIARELHDSAGQTLTVLGMNLAQFVQKTGRTAPEVAGEAETIQEMVQQLHRDIRTTSYLLHPPLLDESGLYSALSWYTQGLVERSGLQIDLQMSQEFGRLPHDMELVVFRLIQECLTNIHRHSGSKLASIRIARESDQVAVEVRDQGAGMTPDRLAQIQSGASGVGIRGMRERLRQFKGELKIASDSGGTRILVTIPVPKTAISQDESSPESLQTAI
jgi:PAS domain S-box-containing protein